MESITDHAMGFKQSPQTFSLGNLSLSMTITFSPALAHADAQQAPAGPPPMIATSYTALDIGSGIRFFDAFRQNTMDSRTRLPS